jgi:hypothetical protein
MAHSSLIKKHNVVRNSHAKSLNVIHQCSIDKPKGALIQELFNVVPLKRHSLLAMLVPSMGFPDLSSDVGAGTHQLPGICDGSLRQVDHRTKFALTLSLT